MTVDLWKFDGDPWKVGRYSGEGYTWMANGRRDGNTYTALFKTWREAYAFAHIATYGTRTAFLVMVGTIEREHSLPEFYMRGIGEPHVPGRCEVCASH